MEVTLKKLLLFSILLCSTFNIQPVPMRQPEQVSKYMREYIGNFWAGNIAAFATAASNYMLYQSLKTKTAHAPFTYLAAISINVLGSYAFYKTRCNMNQAGDELSKLHLQDIEAQRNRIRILPT